MEMDEEARMVLKKPNDFRKRLTVDEAVEEFLGSFGISQFLQVFLVSLARVFDAQATLITIFTDAQPQSWKCIAPEKCGHTSYTSVCELKPEIWEWSVGNTSSTIAEWELICDRRFLAALPTSVFFLGSLFGSAVFGYLADGVLGRKKSLLLSCLLTSTTIFLTSLSPNIFVYTFLRFATGFSRAGIGICCLVLSTEAIGRKWRGQVAQYGFFFFAIGFLSIPLAAYHAKTCWRNLYTIFSFFPVFYSIFLLAPFVSESPRWLLVQGRSEEALDVLKRYAKLNGNELPENLTIKSSFADDDYTRESSSIYELLTTKWTVRRLVLVMITGYGVGLVYFGIQFNVENLDFNLYLSVAINAMMEIPAVFIGGFLISITNRRELFASSVFLAGFSCILCTIFSGKGNKNHFWVHFVQLTVEAFGFMAISNAYNVLYVHCVELFPTNVRNFTVSLLRQALMLGASISPLLVVFGRSWPFISFLTFGLVSIVSGFVIFWLPETRNSPLFETLKQQQEEEEKMAFEFDQLEVVEMKVHR